MTHQLQELVVPASAQDGRVFELNLVGPEGFILGTDFDTRTLQRLGSLCDRMTLRVWPDDYL